MLQFLKVATSSILCYYLAGITPATINSLSDINKKRLFPILIFSFLSLRPLESFPGMSKICMPDLHSS